MSDVSNHFEGFGQLLYLHQSWDLFAPSPSRSGGHWLIVANLTNGTQTEVYSNLVSLHVTAATHSAWYGGSHYLQYYLRIWQHYRMAIERDMMPSLELLGALGRYHCLLSARRLPVESVDISFVHTATPAPDEQLVSELFHLWTQRCLRAVNGKKFWRAHAEQCGVDGTSGVMRCAGGGHQAGESSCPYTRFEQQQDEYEL